MVISGLPEDQGNHYKHNATFIHDQNANFLLQRPTRSTVQCWPGLCRQAQGSAAV